MSSETNHFYCQKKSGTPHWMHRRLVLEERKRLSAGGCRTKLSFYEEYCPGGLGDEGPDGYCKQCGKDFGADGLFCSDGCQAVFEKKGLAKLVNRSLACGVCARRMIPRWLQPKVKMKLGVDLPFGPVVHHISYDPEVTKTICDECHARIHHSDDKELDWLKPPTRRPVKARKTRLVECKMCGGKVRLRLDEVDNNPICSRCIRSPSKSEVLTEAAKAAGMTPKEYFDSLPKAPIRGRSRGARSAGHPPRDVRFETYYEFGRLPNGSRGWIGKRGS